MSPSVATREFTFQTDVGPARAYVAMPADAATAGGSRAGEDGRFPGVLVIHEWWGLNAHTRDLARRFAEAGYVAMAPDLYEGKLATNRDEAGKLMSTLRSENALATMTGAVEALDEEFSVNRIAVVGFCMGGSMALLLACHNNRLSAVIPFYGDHPGEEEMARIHAPILFIGAEDDPWITREKISDMEDILKRRHKDFQIVIPPGTKHAFFNDTRPDAYNAEAAAAVWPRVLDFLEEHLQLEVHAPAGVNPTWPPDMKH